jgi:hypothetical protein
MTRQLLSRSVVTCFLVSAMCAGASADTIFFDNFNDRNAEDGMPVTWETYPGFEGDFSAMTGDLLHAPDINLAMATGVPGLLLGDTSIRAQVRMVETGTSIGMLGRATSEELVVSHGGGISANGVLFIIREEPEFGSNPTSLASVPSDLDPFAEDVLLQFDVFGNMMRLWAWRAGEPIPVEPQLVATDEVPAIGEIGVFFDPASEGNEPGTGMFRFVHVADTHIPEPSTAVLMCLGFACLLACWRKKGGHSRL